jgi:hypothetical protein
MVPPSRQAIYVSRRSMIGKGIRLDVAFTERIRQGHDGSVRLEILRRMI